MQLTRIQQLVIEKISKKIEKINIMDSADIELLEKTIEVQIPQPLLEIVSLYDKGKDLYIESHTILCEEDEDVISSFTPPITWKSEYLWYIEEFNEFIEIDMHDYLVIGRTAADASISIGIRNEVEGQIFWMDFREADGFKYFKIADSFLEFVEML
jgi:hypothetical protein